MDRSSPLVVSCIKSLGTVLVGFLRIWKSLMVQRDMRLFHYPFKLLECGVMRGSLTVDTSRWLLECNWGRGEAWDEIQWNFFLDAFQYSHSSFRIGCIHLALIHFTDADIMFTHFCTYLDCVKRVKQRTFQRGKETYVVNRTVPTKFNEWSWAKVDQLV
jgi:hypothetical protein